MTKRIIITQEATNKCFKQAAIDVDPAMTLEQALEKTGNVGCILTFKGAPVAPNEPLFPLVQQGQLVFVTK